MPINTAIHRTVLSGSVAALALTLSACGGGTVGNAASDSASKAPATAAAPAANRARIEAPAAPRPAARGELGTITAIVPVRTTAPTSGAGAVIGGVVGGALGNQVGKGDGRKAATVIGVIGGAVAGNEIEKDRNTRVTGYRIEVRLDSGRTAAVTTPQVGDLANGQRVRLVDGVLRDA